MVGGLAAATAVTTIALWQSMRRKPAPWWSEGIAGGTAVVTGASSGIGAAFARRLAERGCNLLLVARRGERLQTIANELAQRHAIRADVFVADLARAADIERLAQHVASLDNLLVLVNNAGFGIGEKFVEADPARHADMVSVHVTAPMRLTRSALPIMIARNRGAIINVSSISAFLPNYRSVNYSATKAYLNTFTRALHDGLKGTGVRVQALCPGYTTTEFHDTPDMDEFDRAKVPNKLWMSVDAIVDESLSALDLDKVVVVPGWRYQLIVLAAENGLVGHLMRFYRKLRRRS